MVGPWRSAIRRTDWCYSAILRARIRKVYNCIPVSFQFVAYISLLSHKHQRPLLTISPLRTTLRTRLRRHKYHQKRCIPSAPKFTSKSNPLQNLQRLIHATRCVCVSSKMWLNYPHGFTKIALLTVEFFLNRVHSYIMHNETEKLLVHHMQVRRTQLSVNQDHQEWRNQNSINQQDRSLANICTFQVQELSHAAFRLKFWINLPN